MTLSFYPKTAFNREISLKTLERRYPDRYKALQYEATKYAHRLRLVAFGLPVEELRIGDKFRVRPLINFPVWEVIGTARQDGQVTLKLKSCGSSGMVKTVVFSVGTMLGGKWQQ